MIAIPEDYVHPKEKEEMGMTLRQIESTERYAKQQSKEQFLKVPYRSLDLVITIKDCFPLYFYMCDNVTRGKSRYSFWNEKIVPYYHLNYLPFAKHQEFIAKDLGLSQGSISTQLKILKAKELIARVGIEMYSDRRPMTVWAVGTWVEDEKGRPDEIYFIQSISFT